MVNYRLNRRSAIAGMGALVAAGYTRKRASAATVLRVWTFLDPVNGKTPREVVLRTLIENFEKANPGVKVVVEVQNYQTLAQKFFAAHQTGTAPDIPSIVSAYIAGAVKLGALANLNELFIDGWSDEDRDDVDSPIWRHGSTDNAHYQVPTSAQIYGAQYRIDLFKEAGIDARDLTTWDKFNSSVQKLVAKDAGGSVIRWGFGQTNAGLAPVSPVLLSMLLDRNGQLFDKDLRAVWATPAGAEGLTIETEMIRKHQIMNPAQVNMGNEDVHEQFLSGRVAIARIGTARWLTAGERFGRDNIGYLRTPSFTEGKYSPSEAAAWHLCVWSGSPNKELAGKFLEYVVSKEGDLLWSTVAGQPPTRKSTIRDNAEYFNDPANAILLQIAEDLREGAWLPPLGVGEGGWSEGFNAAFQDVMINGTDPTAALKKAEDAFNAAHGR